MLEAVIFDVDGVIVDSEQLYCQAVQETFSHYGVGITEKEYVRRWMIEQTASRGVIKDYNLGETVTPDCIGAKKKEILWRLIDDELEMMPNAREILEMVYGKYPLGAVSSDARANVLKKLGKFGLDAMFKVIITDEDVGNRKPHPEPYQKAVELLRVCPENTAVIEDNPSGVKSAKAGAAG